ncbi:MAG: RIP metalloprotease RseP [Deltaproteobacteria bacterium]|jgi:regulator of sigma E protease|nr:RIP metalloprotease RseP [Deltaproteobacteria bacterium]
MLTTLISFIVLLLVLIFVHELGHFLAAKLLGIRVEKFSLGFPPKAWSKKIGDTEYQLAWLPLGGYVALFGESPDKEVAPEERKFSFSHKPLWVRAIVVAAGPLFNVIFAIFALWLVNFSVGSQHLAPIVGPVDPAGPAYRAGLLSEDVVLSVNKEPVKFFTDIQTAVGEGAGQSVQLTIQRGQRTLDLTIKPEREEWTNPLGDNIQSWNLGFDPRTRPIIDEVMEGKPAELAGILAGDLVLSVDGKATPDWTDLTRIIRGSDQVTKVDGETIHQEPQAMEVKVERAGVVRTFTVKPILEAVYEADGQTGFAPLLGLKPRLELLREPLGLFGSLGAGLTETWVVTKMTVKTFIRLFQNKISVKVLGGPLMIAEVAGKKAREGLMDYIWVMAIISVNLAIINLVPLPVLDGGQLFFFLIEGLRRRPLSLKFREVCQWVGITAMVALMVLVFYNDIHRWVSRWSGPSVSQIQTGQ